MIVAGAVGLVAALLLTPVARMLAPRIGAVDRPGELKVHEQPMPRFGGSAIWAATLLACALGAVFPRSAVDLRKLGIVLAGATAVALLGAIDDTVGIAPKVRFAVGFAIALAVSTAVLLPSAFSVGRLALILVSSLWLLGCCNALNMLDGLDGLAAGVSAITAGGIGAVAYLAGSATGEVLACALVGACLGFLRYNFRPASTFMGDVGSLFMGFALASGVLLLDGRAAPAETPAVLGVMVALGAPVGDMLLAMARRLINHRPIFRGDRSHFYDQLRDRFGFSVTKTVLIVYVLALALAMVSLCISALIWWQALPATGVVAAAAVVVAVKGGFLRREEPGIR